jgi:hypothetical protein
VDFFLRNGYCSAGKEAPRHTPFYGLTQISLTHAWSTITHCTDVVVDIHILASSLICIVILSCLRLSVWSRFFLFGILQFKICMQLSSLASKLCSYTLSVHSIILKYIMNSSNLESPHHCVLFSFLISLRSRSLHFDPNVTFCWNKITLQ